MLSLAVTFVVLGLALATPPVTRSRQDLEAFRHFLESTKTSNGEQFLARLQSNPKANPEENSGKYQGDIVLDDFIIEDMLKEYAIGRNAYIYRSYKWPQNTVVYDFGEGEFDSIQRLAIEAAMKSIEDHTCIRFRYREAGDRNYVHLTGNPDGCYAHVGYWHNRGVHILNLAPNFIGIGCFRYGTIVHEWMHILGFLHMHSTHDRDNYVRIATENIISGSERSFDVYSSSVVDNLNVEYDYVSCLHYGPYGFTANGLPTIIALQEHEGVMGQREYITDKDWLRINRHYKCPGAWD